MHIPLRPRALLLPIGAWQDLLAGRAAAGCCPMLPFAGGCLPILLRHLLCCSQERCRPRVDWSLRPSRACVHRVCGLFLRARGLLVPRQKGLPWAHFRRNTFIGRAPAPGRAWRGSAARWVHTPLGPAAPGHLQEEEHGHILRVGLLFALPTSSMWTGSPRARGAVVPRTAAATLLSPGLAGTMSGWHPSLPQSKLHPEMPASSSPSPPKVVTGFRFPLGAQTIPKPHNNL